MATLRNVQRVGLACDDLGRSATHCRNKGLSALLLGSSEADPQAPYLLVIGIHPRAARNRLEVGHREVEDGTALRVGELVGVAGLDLDGHGGVQVGIGGVLQVGTKSWVAKSEYECANAECWGCRIDNSASPSYRAVAGVLVAPCLP